VAFAWPHFSAFSASTPANSVTVPFVLDNNRVFVELAFTLPDGTIRTTLGFVDTGNPDFDLSKSLVDALQIEHGKDLRVRLGDLPLKIDGDVQAESFNARSMLPGMNVEANLPAKLLRHYTLILDYGKRTLTLAEPGTLQLDGTIRLPAMNLGSLQLTQIVALGVSSGWDPKTTPRFFDWYSQKTPGPVVAFIGGNVLKAFRMAIDYANGTTYWLRQQTTLTIWIRSESPWVPRRMASIPSCKSPSKTAKNPSPGSCPETSS
jgi:hypothetical protein